MLGVNRARTFAQAQAVAENLRTADSTVVNETGEAVETEKPAFQFRFRPDRLNAARPAINKSAKRIVTPWPVPVSRSTNNRRQQPKPRPSKQMRPPVPAPLGSGALATE
jgi:O-glycosyl hydrolase